MADTEKEKFLSSLPEYVRELIPAIMMKGELSVARFVAYYGDEHPHISKDRKIAYELLLMGYIKGAISMVEEMHEALGTLEEEQKTKVTPDFDALEKSLRDYLKQKPPKEDVPHDR